MKLCPGRSSRPDAALLKNKVCLYTCVEKARFIIDRLPDNDRMIIASACSGHGFKHSGEIGELWPQMALGEEHRDIAMFGFR